MSTFIVGLISGAIVGAYLLGVLLFMSAAATGDWKTKKQWVYNIGIIIFWPVAIFVGVMSGIFPGGACDRIFSYIKDGYTFF